MKQTIVLKLGGSLIDSVELLLISLNELSERYGLNIVIVPGGGVFADTVRKYGSKLSDGAAHTMAILAMDQYGIYLADLGGIRVIDRLDEIEDLDGVSILLLNQIMKERDPLPQTWDVTSDTIAAWVSKELNGSLIKLTDVDGVFRGGELLSVVSAGSLRLLDSSCTDKGLPDFLIRHDMDCIVINGRYPDRLKRVIDERAFKGTVIRGIDRELEECFR
ncbi:MAG: amino acid kinase [Candidatus Syntrophoarchaeum sp.]|nr:amino acid kinase [Candidatus Syntrophoarchaeum sp.]